MAFLLYIRCIQCCIISVDNVISTQHESPRRRGLPPVLTSFTISVLRPIAAIARTIMNFERSLNGVKNEGLTPSPVAIVVMTDAAMK